jgi:DNA-binding LacI/PurR family transcriptional regulator
MGYPFFMIDPAQNMPYPKVEVGRRQAFREGTMALADKGRRRIALVTQNFRRQERLVGYREGLELSGLQEDSELIFHCERGFEGGRVVGAQLSARVRAGEIDGLLCHNDRIALGIMQQLHRHGIVIPRDVSIVGFDNDAYGAFTTPSLSTMEQGRQDVGVYIYEQIHGNLEKGLSLQNRHFNAHLIIRESI